MIIVKIWGGLGNQMFQYAFGKNIAVKNNLELKLDTSYFKEQKLRNFELDKFNIVAAIASIKEIKKVKKENSTFNKLYRKFNTLTKPRNKQAIIEEIQFNHEAELNNIKQSCYLNGYWQSEKYFNEISTTIQNEFALKKTLSINAQIILTHINNQPETCSIHIRRGDYVTEPITNVAHGICTLSYYQEALSLLTSQKKITHVYFFSDDIPWVKENFKIALPHSFVDKSKNQHEDLILMSKCKNNIIANSSFSWWAAWLNANTNKVVIAPKQWFQNRDSNTIDLIPQTWIKV